MQRWICGFLLDHASVALLLALLASSHALSLASDGETFSFAVYYGSSWSDELVNYDLLILSPLYSESYVSKLREEGAVVLGYVSISTVGGWEPWASQVTDDIVLSYDPTWGEKIVNASSLRWRRILLEEAIPWVLSKGFDGVFLDNLDVVDAYPQLRTAIVSLVKEVRGSFPDIVVAVNRGFSIVEEVAPYVNYVVFESFGTYYDFSEGCYKKWSGSDLRWIKTTSEKLSQLSSKHGFKVLVLAYADPNNSEQFAEYVSFVKELASKYGFSYYVADVYLQHVTPLHKLVEAKPESEAVPTASLVGAFATSLAVALLFAWWWSKRFTPRPSS